MTGWFQTPGFNGGQSVTPSSGILMCLTTGATFKICYTSYKNANSSYSTWNLLPDWIMESNPGFVTCPQMSFVIRENFPLVVILADQAPLRSWLCKGWQSTCSVCYDGNLIWIGTYPRLKSWQTQPHSDRGFVGVHNGVVVHVTMVADPYRFIIRFVRAVKCVYRLWKQWNQRII